MTVTDLPSGKQPSGRIASNNIVIVTIKYFILAPYPHPFRPPVTLASQKPNSVWYYICQHAAIIKRQQRFMTRSTNSQSQQVGLLLTNSLPACVGGGLGLRASCVGSRFSHCMFTVRERTYTTHTRHKRRR
jgi:hypothetical protein